MAEFSDDEVAELTGLPINMLTPEVRDAILSLLRDKATLIEEVAFRKQREAELERLADEDSLVPISNRRSFMRELSRAIRCIERYGTPGSVLYFDLNNLKRINDTLGHAAGDAALKHIAELLLRHLRASDVFARLGGDEFAVLLMWADLETARSKAEALAELVRSRPLEWEGQKITLELAHGAYAFAPGESAEAVVQAADSEMYARKRAMKATDTV
ncbi:MAG: GGDEF domain-containing protein [Geminicoccaceae bacterium]